MYNFVTLFDKNYLSRGLALYDSLLKHCDDFFIYILTLDEETKMFLTNKNKKNIHIISLNEIESFYPELAEIKKNRSVAEYCWTLTPYSIQYTIKTFKLDSCTYLDADIYFYNNPKIIFDEAKGYSIIITEHRYTPKDDQTKTSGKYCVQFTYFKNDNDGMEALEWWRQRCGEWCYNRYEDGKFGDQKYLDDWITRFTGVYVPKHIGCGLAPWNIQQFTLSNENNILYVQDKITKIKQLVVFYHFHSLRELFINSKEISYYLCGYYLDSMTIELIYIEYVKLLSAAISGSTFKSIKCSYKKPSLFYLCFIFIKHSIKSILNIFKFKKLYKSIIDNYTQENNKKFTVNLE